MIFRNCPGKTDAPMVSKEGFLGDWTSENDSDDFITTFACSGAKSYGMITCKGKSKIRCKGTQYNIGALAAGFLTVHSQFYSSSFICLPF